MKTSFAVCAIFLCCATAFCGSVDSVTVDSVWNSDSSWYDTNGILQQRPARDCFISFFPLGTGTVLCSLAISVDGGTTWNAMPNPLRILDNSTDTTFHCGMKGRIKARVFGADRQNVVFKVITKTCGPGFIVLFNEGFETDLAQYSQVTYDPAQGMMSISTQHAHSGNGSLTSDSNNTGIKRGISPQIDDSIAGLQFYLMATKAAHTDFIVAICKPGSSANGLFTIMGMGIDKSDSLKYVYENAPGDPINEHKNFAALTLNKWYKCKIEYDYSDTTLTYFLDDATVYTRTTPSPMTLRTFVVMRDSLGAQGPSGYYVDDVTIYKR